MGAKDPLALEFVGMASHDQYQDSLLSLSSQLNPLCQLAHSNCKLLISLCQNGGTISLLSSDVHDALDGWQPFLYM